ncbi:MAG: stage II sporulation protein M [Planctomycetota bacterium]
MKRDRFIRQRTPYWKRLELLIDQTKGKSASSLNGKQITELSHLYRMVCYDLSMVKSREWGTQLEQYLNDLVAQGHNCLYRKRPPTFAAILNFFTSGFPRTLRKRKWYFYTALALFAVPFFAGMILALVDPVLAESVIPAEMLEEASDSYSEELYVAIDEKYFGERTFMAGFYVFNNVGIALKIFSTGVFLGIPTIKELLFNGIVLGMISGYVASQGHGDEFFSFVISHGSFELTGIVIAGAAGLLLGFGLIKPGRRSRSETLAEYGKDAVLLAIGAAVMLMIAALIEGYFSPMAIPSIVKYVVGTLMWLVVIAYLALAGRRSSADDEADALKGGIEDAR